MHDKDLKKHESEGWILFEVFEKLTRACCFSKIARIIYLHFKCFSISCIYSLKFVPNYVG